MLGCSLHELLGKLRIILSFRNYKGELIDIFEIFAENLEQTFSKQLRMKTLLYRTERERMYLRFTANDVNWSFRLMPSY